MLNYRLGTVNEKHWGFKPVFRKLWKGKDLLHFLTFTSKYCLDLQNGILRATCHFNKLYACTFVLS